jgi:alkyl hydroperoxide reductase subunit AhpC
MTRKSFAATMPRAGLRPSLFDMSYTIGAAAPQLAAEAFIRGERKRRIELDDFRGSWVVVAYAAPHHDVLALAQLEEAFGADGAIVLATTPDDVHEAEARYSGEPVRFPILTDVDETRRITMIVDPGGVVRHVGLRRDPRETLAALEALVAAPRLTLAA